MNRQESNPAAFVRFKSEAAPSSMVAARCALAKPARSCRSAFARLREFWDPIEATRGVGFLAVLGLSLWCEWKLVAWLYRLFLG